MDVECPQKMAPGRNLSSGTRLQDSVQGFGPMISFFVQPFIGMAKTTMKAWYFMQNLFLL